MAALAALSLLFLATGASAQPPDSVSVTLPIYDLGGGEFKLGIYLQLGSSPTPNLYEFDTGSSGLFAAPYNFEGFESTGQNVNQEYFSGIVYNSTIVTTNCSVWSAAGTAGQPGAPQRVSGATAVNIGVGRTYNGYNFKKPESMDFNTSVANGGPPFLFGVFWGDSGMGFSSTGGLFNVLPQMPGNLASGFVLDLGPAPTPVPLKDGPKIVSYGTMTLGITNATRAQFPSVFPMAGKGVNGPFPAPNPLNLTTYRTTLTAGTMCLQNADAGCANGPIYQLFDTGAPTMTIHDTLGTVSAAFPRGFFSNSSGGIGGLRNNVDVTFALNTSSGTPVPYEKLTTGSGNPIGYTSSFSAVPVDYINTGIQAFFGRSVMFDALNGVVGVSTAGQVAGCPCAAVTPVPSPTGSPTGTTASATATATPLSTSRPGAAISLAVGWIAPLIASLVGVAALGF